MNLKFRNPLVAIAVFFFVLSIQIQAQSDSLNLVFKKDGKPLKIENVKIDIVSINTKEVLRTLAVTNRKVLIPPELSDLGNFNVRISFDKYQLFLADLNSDYFDNEWEIDVGNALNKKQAKKSKIQCTKSIRVFRVDFHPSNSEGFWWLLPGCSR